MRITPEKGSRARIFKISDRLKTMLLNLKTNSEQIWHYKRQIYLDRAFRRMQMKTAHNLGNPRLLQIHFHTLRHWKATIEYARTKDIFYVMKFLGHKNIKNTLIYTQLVEFTSEEEYHVKVARTLKETCELVKAGFDHVTDLDDAQIFRKRR